MTLRADSLFNPQPAFNTQPAAQANRRPADFFKRCRSRDFSQCRNEKCRLG